MTFIVNDSKVMERLGVQDPVAGEYFMLKKHCSVLVPGANLDIGGKPFYLHRNPRIFDSKKNVVIS
jgi:hypothetical protein